MVLKPGLYGSQPVHRSSDEDIRLIQQLYLIILLETYKRQTSLLYLGHILHGACIIHKIKFQYGEGRIRVCSVRVTWSNGSWLRYLRAMTVARASCAVK